MRLPPPGMQRVIERISQIEKRFSAPKTADDFKRQLETAVNAREQTYPGLDPGNPAQMPQASVPPQLKTLLTPGSGSSEDVRAAVQQAASAFGLDAGLIDAVIRAESAYNPQAVSPKGAQGLMQLMPGTAAELGVADPFDIHENVMGGSRYLRSMLDRFDGDLERALAAYNAGPGAVNRFDGIPPYQETRQYVERVLRFYRSGM